MSKPYKFPTTGDVFLLKDGEGYLRGLFHTDEHGNPAIRLLDRNGDPKVELTVTPEGEGSLTLYNKEGKPYFQVP